MLKFVLFVAAVALQTGPPSNYTGTYWAAVYTVTSDGIKREVPSTLLHREDCESLGGHKRVRVERPTITNHFSFCQMCFHPTRPHHRAPSVSAATAYDPDGPREVILSPQRQTQTSTVRQDNGRSWSGQGSKQTPSFYMTSREWTVKWNHSGEGYFAVQVYDDNDEHVALIANIIGPGADMSSVRAKPGKFYLKITGDTWTVSVP